jgi:hypothetical protein
MSPSVFAARTPGLRRYSFETTFVTGAGRRSGRLAPESGKKMATCAAR